nr:MAG TPA: hypothetical protein [Caudoviricetes sp.]
MQNGEHRLCRRLLLTDFHFCPRRFDSTARRDFLFISL